MNKKTALKYIPLIKAYAEGKIIQQALESPNGWTWSDILGDVAFALPVERYRIKPNTYTMYAIINKQNNVAHTTCDLGGARLILDMWNRNAGGDCYKIVTLTGEG